MTPDIVYVPKELVITILCVQDLMRLYSCSYDIVCPALQLDLAKTCPNFDVSNIGEIHYHKGRQNKWSKQIELSAGRNQFEKKIKSGNK